MDAKTTLLAAIGAGFALALVYAIQQASRAKTLKEELEKEKERGVKAGERATSERLGRTKAEKDLRTMKQAVEKQQDSMGCGIKVIGTLKCCFPERWGTPRQSLLVPSARATLKLEPKIINSVDALADIDRFSHCWVVFIFHENTNSIKAITQPTSSVKAKVHPPRLNGERVGLFSTRTPHRPNPIGLSIAKIEEFRPDGTLVLSGIDLMDGTPILDIKPYLHTDIVPLETLKVAPWVLENHQTIGVTFSESADKQLDEIFERYSQGKIQLEFYKTTEKELLRNAILESLSLDIRPVHKRRSKKAKDEEPKKVIVEELEEALRPENRPARAAPRRPLEVESDETRYRLKFDKLLLHFVNDGPKNVKVLDVSFAPNAKLSGGNGSDGEEDGGHE